MWPFSYFPCSKKKPRCFAAVCLALSLLRILHLLALWSNGLKPLSLSRARLYYQKYLRHLASNLCLWSKTYFFYLRFGTQAMASLRCSLTVTWCARREDVYGSKSKTRVFLSSESEIRDSSSLKRLPDLFLWMDRQLIFRASFSSHLEHIRIRFSLKNARAFSFN